jgi:hypothetical protein
MSDEPSEDLSALEQFMTENNSADAGVTCRPPANTVFCQPGTCTRTIIIVSVE